MKAFLPGQILARRENRPLAFDYDEGVLDGVYLVLGIIDSDADIEKFVDYAEYSKYCHVYDRNFQYRMIAPDGTIVCYNVPYMDDKYRSL